jgi:hypothetical protein
MFHGSSAREGFQPDALEQTLAPNIRRLASFPRSTARTNEWTAQTHEECCSLARGRRLNRPEGWPCDTRKGATIPYSCRQVRHGESQAAALSALDCRVPAVKSKLPS